MDTKHPLPAMPQTSQILNRKEIHFPNGNIAWAVTTPTTIPAGEVLNALHIQKPKALLMVIGGASNLDDSLCARLTLLCNLGIARVAAEAEALIIDGGTQAGIMALMGQAVADRDHKSTLLGVSPDGLVTYPDKSTDGSQSEHEALDPNHSHFILVEGSYWGVETSMMFKLADELSRDEQGNKIPVVTILVNGGEIVKHEAWYCVQRGWPIIVIEGSDRTADEVAKLWRKKNEEQKQPKRRFFFWHSQKKSAKQQNDIASIEDSELTEIIEKGDIHLFPLTDPVEQFEKSLKQLLYRSDVLSHAWELFALYDENAKRQQSNFYRLQKWIVGVGVLVTAVVVAQVLLRSNQILRTGTPWDQTIHAIIVLLPIIVSVLIAGAGRFTPGNKWILLRASAEAIKREIYRYRTGTGDYQKEAGPSAPSVPMPQSPSQVKKSAVSSARPKPKLSPQEIFTEKITDISRHLMQTEINMSALRPYNGPIPPKMYGAEAKDDGYSKLTPDRYIAIRIGDQLGYFRSKTNALAKDLTRFYWLIFLAGGLGTLLAALGFEPVVALTAAIAAAFASYLEYRQVEYTLTKYNQTASNLNNAQLLWVGLPEEKHSENFSQLVTTTEQILETENMGWVQQMHDALTKLRETQEKSAKTGSVEEQPGQGEQGGANHENNSVSR